MNSYDCLTKQEWRELLFSIWKGCHNYPHWNVVVACHDDEDKAYFDLLNEMSGFGKEIA